MGIGLSEVSTPATDPGEVLTLVGLGGFLVGGPVIHFAHGNSDRGLGSLGLRTALPLALGSLLYYMNDSCGHGDFICEEGAAVAGGLLGMLAASTIDAAWLGYEEVPIETPGVKNIGVSLGRDHAALVAGGTF